MPGSGSSKLALQGVSGGGDNFEGWRPEKSRERANQEKARQPEKAGESEAIFPFVVDARLVEYLAS